MFREPKAMREIHKIQEQLAKERKITDKDFVEKTKQSVEAIKRKYGLRTKVKTVA